MAEDEGREVKSGPQPAAVIPAVTRQSFAEFVINRLGPAAKCPLCGHSAFQLLTWPDLTMVNIFLGAYKMTTTPFPDGHYKMFGLSCGNCGNTHLLNRLIYDQWAAEEAEKKKSEGDGQ